MYKLGTFYSVNGPLLGSNKCNTLVDIGMGVLKKFGKGLTNQCIADLQNNPYTREQVSEFRHVNYYVDTLLKF